MDDKYLEDHPKDRSYQVSRKRSFLSVFFMLALSQCAQGKTSTANDNQTLAADYAHTKLKLQYVRSIIYLDDDDNDKSIITEPKKEPSSLNTMSPGSPQETGTARDLSKMVDTTVRSCVLVDPSGDRSYVRMSPGGRIVHKLADGTVVHVLRSENINGATWFKIDGNPGGYIISTNFSCRTSIESANNRHNVPSADEKQQCYIRLYQQCTREYLDRTKGCSTLNDAMRQLSCNDISQNTWNQCNSDAYNNAYNYFRATCH